MLEIWEPGENPALFLISDTCTFITNKRFCNRFEQRQQEGMHAAPEKELLYTCQKEGMHVVPGRKHACCSRNAPTHCTHCCEKDACMGVHYFHVTHNRASVVRGIAPFQPWKAVSSCATRLHALHPPPMPCPCLPRPNHASHALPLSCPRLSFSVLTSYSLSSPPMPCFCLPRPAPTSHACRGVA